MFKNEFQGGPYFEIFSAQAKDSVSQWKLSSSGIKKGFDKDVRSFVFTVEGSAVTTKMCIPKDNKASLTLIQRFLIIQLYVPKGLDFSLDLGISDLGNQKRRLVLSTTHRETQTNPLHSKIPLGFIKKSKWLNLCLDLLSLVRDTWHGQTYKCVDSICIAGNCRLRRIFTMRNQPPDTTDDEELYGFGGTNSSAEMDSVPKQCQLAPDVPQDVQVVTMTKVRYYESRGRPPEALTSRSISQDQDLNSSGGKKSGSQDSYHIAFGTKMSGQQPRKGSGKDKEGSSTSRQAKASGSGKPESSGDGSQSSRLPQPPRNEKEYPRRDKPGSGSSRDRKYSDPGTNTEDLEVSVDKDSLQTSDTWTDAADNKDSIPYVKPHPPRQPSSEKRRRPRVKSAGKERTPHSFSRDESSSQSVSSSAHSSLNSNHSQSQSLPGSATKSRTREPRQYAQPDIVANEDEVERFMREIQESASRDHRRSETESEPDSHNVSGTQDPDDSLSEVIKALNDRGLGDDETHEYEESDGDIDTDQLDVMSQKPDVYTFSSRPTSVKSDLNKQTTKKSHRTRIRRKSDLEGHRKEAFGRRLLEPSGDTIRSFPDSSEEEDVDEQSQITPRAGPKPRKVLPRKHDAVPQISRLKQPPLNVVPPAFTDSGLLQVAPLPTKSPHTSQTRMSVNRKSLREIPKEELRRSGGQKPYNSTKYQMMDLSDSFEARMLESMRREQLEGGSSSEDEPRPRPGHQPTCQELDSLSGSSDETEMSTLKNMPKPNANNYQEEMKILSQEFLTQSNPRDWSSVMSPPIVPAIQNGTTESLAPSSKISALKSDALVVGDAIESDGDGELDLLYDPVLNCYYDPKSCKYYELV